MKKTPMTVVGVEKLKAELHRLKTVERPRIIQAIAEARSHGDLSENAEYHAAKEQQGFVEGRIAELDMKLATAQIIDPKTVNADGRVVVGRGTGTAGQEAFRWTGGVMTGLGDLPGGSFSSKANDVSADGDRKSVV